MSARELYIGLLLRGRGTMGTGEISNAVIPHAMLAVSVGFAYFVAQRYPHSHLHLPFAMCHVLFSICHSHSCILAGQCSGGGMRHEARLLSLRFLAFVWLCCLRLCHFCRSCNHRRRLNSTHLPLLLIQILLLPSSVYILCMLFVHWL